MLLGEMMCSSNAHPQVASLPKWTVISRMPSSCASAFKFAGCILHTTAVDSNKDYIDVLLRV